MPTAWARNYRNENLAESRSMSRGSGRSLHRHALGKISGLVDVRAASDGGVVGEQLQRHDVQDRREHAVVLGHADDVNTLARLDPRIGIGKDEKLAAARP